MEGHGAVLPVRISSAVIKQEGDNVCPSQEAVNALLNATNKEIKQVINDVVDPYLNPCGSSGWIRVAYLNMTDPGSVCPTNWTLHTSPVRGCGQTQTDCASAFFSARNLKYSRVCGRIQAYQKGKTDAFHNSVSFEITSIDSTYVDGVSVTHGSAGSRQHIWTFAAAHYDENLMYQSDLNCLCTNTRYNWSYQLPSFIQNNYFCDTGNPGPRTDSSMYYSSDPLWDGAGCGEDSTCCQFNNPPWFYSSLPQATTDDVEVRLCFNYPSDEDAIIYLLEVFVQQ